jgi:hypothetical protein
MPKKTNGAHPPDVKTQAELLNGVAAIHDVNTDPEAEYRAEVEEAKQLIAKTGASVLESNMRLGKLADGVETKYKGKTLNKFAGDIGMTDCVLGRLRSVYRAWYGEDFYTWLMTLSEDEQGSIKASPPILPSFEVARELQAHPDRFELIRQNSKMTSKEARALRLALKDPDERKKKDDNDTPILRTTRTQLQRIQRAANDAKGVALKLPLTREQKAALLAVFEPTCLPVIKAGGEALIATGTIIEQLQKEAAEEKAEREECKDLAAEAMRASAAEWEQMQTESKQDGQKPKKEAA